MIQTLLPGGSAPSHGVIARPSPVEDMQLVTQEQDLALVGMVRASPDDAVEEQREDPSDDKGDHTVDDARVVPPEPTRNTFTRVPRAPEQ